MSFLKTISLYFNRYLNYIIILILATVGYYLYNDYVNKNIDAFELFEENKIKIMLFAAEWCGYCKKLKPEWNKFEEKIKKDKILSNKVIVTKYDNEKDKELFKKYNIKSFPTILLIDKKANIHNFEGERTVDGLMTFVNEHI